MNKHRKLTGFTTFDFIAVLVIVLLVAAFLFSVFTRYARHRPVGYRSSCQFNLKELALVMQMYWNDYDTTLPSSILHQRKKSKVWDARAAAEFCAEYGTTPPPEHLRSQDVHWVQLLWPHMKNKEIMWCTSDPSRPHREGFLRLKKVSPGPRSLATYIYKPALDRAWFSGYKKEGQFDYVADQIMFFEHTGWHWGDAKKGWRDDVSLNCAFLDGHVRNVRLREAAGCPTPRNVAELTKALARDGEPMWYNFDARAGKLVTYDEQTFPEGKHRCGKLVNPDKYYDNLP